MTVLRLVQTEAQHHADLIEWDIREAFRVLKELRGEADIPDDLLEALSLLERD